jgi:FixJ family two-component response regulator
MSPRKDTVFVIDDDLSVRRSLTLFLTASGHRVESFESMEEYLSREYFKGTGCLVLDLFLNGAISFQLQDLLNNQKSHLPVIFITGQGDIQKSVHALKNGAVNFLEKPFDDQDLLKSIDEALELSHKLFNEKEEVHSAHLLIKSLTTRETEVLALAISGLLNKQIAAELHVAEQTVKIHRQNICTKLGVKSVPEIIRIVNSAGISTRLKGAELLQKLQLKQQQQIPEL